MSSENSGIFAARLREAREKRGMSQQNLAEQSGLQATAISHFEADRRSPSFDNLRKLADALEVSTDFLLGREPELISQGPKIAALFRKAQDLSENQKAIEELNLFADFLAARDKEEKKDG